MSTLLENLPKASSPQAQKTFDGVICFGGCDWWYHNRGHYDLQMMREFSARFPVLYVNSIGARVPRIGEGKMFLTRIRRKLKSLSRGFVRVRDRFGVVSPAVIPGKTGMALSKSLLAPQVRAAARKMDIHRPLVWIECTPAAHAIDALHPAAVIYQRTDRWEEFPDCDRAQMLQHHHFLQQRADLTLFCATLLYEEQGPGSRHAAYVDHGVDFDRFAAAGDDSSSQPEDLKAIPRPRVGFVGGIDSHTFDPPMFLEIARGMPDVQFILVGGCSLAQDWCTLPNVHLLGRRPYEFVAAYMAACNVLIMPWNKSKWIQACNPVKLKEYLAVGRPVVSSDFRELCRYDGYVHVARSAPEFVQQIRIALTESADAPRLRARVREETWAAKAQAVICELQSQGIVPALTRHAPPAMVNS